MTSNIIVENMIALMCMQSTGVEAQVQGRGAEQQPKQHVQSRQQSDMKHLDQTDMHVEFKQQDSMLERGAHLGGSESAVPNPGGAVRKLVCFALVLGIGMSLQGMDVMDIDMPQGREVSLDVQRFDKPPTFDDKGCPNHFGHGHFHGGELGPSSSEPAGHSIG